MTRFVQQRCACGEPLHYTDRSVQAAIERMVVLLGPDVQVTVGKRTWLVPRHYLALHGIKAQELPALAEKLGFAEMH